MSELLRGAFFSFFLLGCAFHSPFFFIFPLSSLLSPGSPRGCFGPRANRGCTPLQCLRKGHPRGPSAGRAAREAQSSVLLAFLPSSDSGEFCLLDRSRPSCIDEANPLPSPCPRRARASALPPPPRGSDSALPARSSGREGRAGAPPRA